MLGLDDQVEASADDLVLVVAEPLKRPGVDGWILRYLGLKWVEASCDSLLCCLPRLEHFLVRQDFRGRDLASSEGCPEPAKPRLAGEPHGT